MLILKTLALEPMHGYGIAVRLEQMGQGVFRVNAGSLFVAFQRLERAGLTKGEWKATERSEEHTSELQSRLHLVCRLLLEKKNDHAAITDRRRAARVTGDARGVVSLTPCASRQPKTDVPVPPAELSHPGVDRSPPTVSRPY